MRKLLWLTVAALAVLAGCTTTKPKPAADVSGAGFVLETPNAAARAALPGLDRQFAEQVVVNRAACLAAPMCRK
jgi:hypothetical protein